MTYWSWWSLNQTHNRIWLSYKYARDCWKVKCIATIENYLKCLRLLKQLDIWVPHEAKEIYLKRWTNVYNMHLKRNDINVLIKRIVTDDEKRIVLNNINRKWSRFKRNDPEPHQKLNCIKSGHVLSLVRLQRCCELLAVFKEPNSKFRYLLSTANETEGNWRFGKS